MFFRFSSDSPVSDDRLIHVGNESKHFLDRGMLLLGYPQEEDWPVTHPAMHISVTNSDCRLTRVHHATFFEASLAYHSA